MSVLFPPLSTKQLSSRQADFQGEEVKGENDFKGQHLCIIRRIWGGGHQEWKMYHNYLCSYLLAIFDYEKGWLTLKKRRT